MPQTFASTDAVELAVVERSGFIESRHIGAAIVLGPSGDVLEQFGDASALILPRSAIKPMIALACLTAGAVLDDERLALSTASHTGTDRHVAVVRDILDAARLDERALQCPAAWPSDPHTREALTREGGEPGRLRMNCSGKHATMLLACVANGWDLATYLDPAHPLQVQIRETLERFSGERMAATAVDGCGAPVYAMSLHGLAKAFHRVATSSEKSPFALHRTAGALVRAVREHPWAIDGPGRPDTVAIEKLGVFSKYGAEGVQVMTAPDGTTVALKVLDGSNRAATAVALRLLERHQALPSAGVAEVMTHLSLSVTGGGRDVGVIRPAF